MGFYVHLSVTFNANSEDIGKLKPIVAKYRKYIKKEWDDVSTDGKHECEWSSEAYWFLDALLDKKNYNCGPKGELFTWGIVGNCTSAENFVDSLEGLFEQMLKGEVSIMDFEHILVFWESEQSEQANAYELFLDDDTKKIVKKEHELPFCWNQH